LYQECRDLTGFESNAKTEGVQKQLHAKMSRDTRKAKLIF